MNTSFKVYGFLQSAILKISYITPWKNFLKILIARSGQSWVQVLWHDELRRNRAYSSI